MALIFMRRSSRNLNNVANFGIFTKKVDYKECYKVLGIDESSDQEQIRKAYLNLVKRYHPDSGTEEACPEKFQQVDKAFKILINKKSKERWDVEEGVIVNPDELPDIKHTAPQHRQYLSYDGIGSGTPFQRQKQYSKLRAMHAAVNVMEHKIQKTAADEKSLLDKNRIHESWEKVPLNHKVKTKHGVDRLVEDLIQESMSKGEFKNLKGEGKPLSSHQNRNPYVDFITHKLNEILIENGFTPEWITLHKEIKDDVTRLRNDLLTERKYFGPYPLSVEENIKWSDRVYKYKEEVDKINKKITQYNLVVPVLNKQMLHIRLENEAHKVVLDGKSSNDILQFDKTERRSDSRPVIQTSSAGEVTVNLFSLIDYFFKSK
nr:unnamed protein product [Callosobruchus analis]